MKTVLFSCLDTTATTGARYAERVMREALEKNYRVTVLNHSNFPKLHPVAFCALSMLLGRFHDITVTSDNYIPADMVYVQPHAGGDVKFPWWDSMTFRGDKPPLYLKVLEPLARHTYKNAMLLGNSGFTAAMLVAEFHKPVYTLYPPVPCHMYFCDPDVRRTNNDIITISSLNPRKNLPFIAEVAEHLPNQMFNLMGHAVQEHMDILGNLYQRFERLNAGFRFHPSVSDYWKASTLTRSKVYFHPTIDEPFGIAIVEAMAAGCIPIVHNSGGPVGFVPEEYRYNTAEEAAIKIKTAILEWNPSTARKMIQISAGYSEENFKRNFLDYMKAL